MALINCPECGKSVSSKAPACPVCGVNVADELKKKKIYYCPKCGKMTNKTEAYGDLEQYDYTVPLSEITPVIGKKIFFRAVCDYCHESWDTHSVLIGSESKYKY